MTKWQHFLHAFGIHDWHKVKEYDQEYERTPCGPFDPRPKTDTYTAVEKVCCQCGAHETRPWSLDWY